MRAVRKVRRCPSSHSRVSSRIDDYIGRANHWHGCWKGMRHVRRFLKARSCAFLALAALAAFVGLSSSHVAMAASDREIELESKVENLEARLQRLEAALSARAAPTAAAARSAARKREPGKAVSSQQSAAAGAMPPPSGSAAAASPSAYTVITDGKDASASVQELAVLRQNSVTLKPRRFELSTEFGYVTRLTDLQTDRSALFTTALRYGVLDWLEVSASLPWGVSDRQTRIGPSRTIMESVRGVGDTLLQANARLLEQTHDYPGVVLSLGALIPTGPNPYNFSQYRLDGPNAVPVPNPRNPLASYFSTGSWGARTNLQVYKTVDPLILFFGVGADYIAPFSKLAYQVDTQVRFNYNLGMSFAVSEKTTLGFSISGAYQPNLRVNGRQVAQSSSEPIVARLTLIQRIYKDYYLEPTVAVGITKDVPDVALGLGVRAQF